MDYTPLILFALGQLGIAIHVLVKIDSINRKSEGNFKFWPFFKLEWPSIMLSECVVVVCLIARSEIKQLEQVGAYLGLGFVTIGYMAQSLVYKVIGKAEKKLSES